MTMKKQRHSAFILPIFATLVLSSCANTNKLKYQKSSLAGLPSTQSELSSQVTNSADKQLTVNNKVNLLPPMQSDNTISAQQQLQQQQYSFDQQAPIAIAVENMPIRDFIHYVFGDLLSVNYVLDESIVSNKQRVSLKVEEPINSDEFFELVNNLLHQKKLTVQFKQKVFYVYELGSVKDENQIMLGLGNRPSDVPLGADSVLQLVPLNYTSYSRISRVMNNLVSAQVFAESDYAGVSIKGKRSQVVKALNLIQLLDQPAAKSQYIGIFPLVFLTPSKFTQSVQSLLRQDGFDINNGVYFTPIEHLNSVVVHSSNQSILDRIEMWQETLDKASETSDKKYFIFYPKRADANTLGGSLNNILALQKGASTSSSKATGNGGKDTTEILDGIAVDQQRNALVFYMQPKQYQGIYSLLNQLDVLPKQVIIEATIMEVTLTDKLSHGVEWFIKNSTDSFGTKGGIGKVAGGLSFTLNKPGVDVVMNALASTNQVNIVSNPKLMVTSGEAATLNVGTEIPTISSTVQNATEGSGQVLQSIQYRSTGINLSVTPTVNAQNYVALDIQQQLSEAGENELSGIDSPIVLNRDLKTKVLVEEGQTLILAGLISENLSDKDTKVPLLGDIPIIGEAFKNTSETTVRTELLLMITPKVLSNSDDFNHIKRAIGSKFKQIDLKENF